MTLVCIRAFGNFAPGDEVEVPDGASYDGAHFAEKTQPTAPPVTAQESE